MDSANDIKVLRGAEAIRARPEMYVRDVHDRLLPNQLLQEALCVALDDGANGTCQNVRITIAAGGEAEVEDDGPGWSLEPDRSGQPRAAAFMTQLFACRQAKESERSQRACQVSLAVLNAFSEWAELTIWQGAFEWRQAYARGEALAAFERGDATPRQGTRLKFKLDAAFLPHTEFSTPELAAWIAENACTVKVVLSDERTR